MGRERSVLWAWEWAHWPPMLRPRDFYRFYEINPAVESMAKEYFHFLSGCVGRTEIVLGDCARLALDRDQTPQNFDVLVLDAFSGDAIPVHLLTAEAFADSICADLAPEGVIAVHISNRHFRISARSSRRLRTGTSSKRPPSTRPPASTAATARSGSARGSCCRARADRSKSKKSANGRSLPTIGGFRGPTTMSRWPTFTG